jgi:hypothetical protein
MNKNDIIECTYSKQFPIDKYDRPGGLYSLSDLPISNYVKLSREGIVKTIDHKNNTCLVKDKEKDWEFTIPLEDVVMKNKDG